MKLSIKNKEEFIKNLIDLGYHSFKIVSNNTLMFQDKRDTIFVHIFPYNEDDDNEYYNHIVHVFSEAGTDGTGVIEGHLYRKIRDDEDWENAIQMILHRF